MENKNSEAASASHGNKNMEDNVSQHVPKSSTLSNFAGPKDEGIITAEHNKEPDFDSFGEVNMEALISADDMMRAGGFGARDDISSFLPVASDSTDFEASLRDARDYEEPQREVSRPGLGWTKGT